MKEVVAYFKQELKANQDFEQQKEAFWNLGKQIKDYSSAELRLLHILLLEEYGNDVLISIRNLQNMKKFYSCYSNYPTIIKDFPNVTWYMHVRILKHCTRFEDCLYVLEISEKNHYTSCQMERLMNAEGWKKTSKNDILIKERR